jgi:hypothetical protein
MTVDFTREYKNLIEDGLSHILQQYEHSCVLRKVLVIILEEIQELYDACQEAQRRRCLEYATNYELEVLGRIVGQERESTADDESTWMYANDAKKNPDSIQTWSYKGALGRLGKMTDSKLRDWITFKILKNHALTTSLPELGAMVQQFWKMDISIVKAGKPFEASMYVPNTISDMQLYYLQLFRTNRMCDRDSLFPYPATLRFTGEVYYRPKNTLWCDDNSVSQRCDRGRCAISLQDENSANTLSSTADIITGDNSNG